MVGRRAPKTINGHFVRLGQNLALILPQGVMRDLSFLAGSSARVIVLEDEFRVRRVSAPRLYDLESLDEYRERRDLEDADSELPDWRQER